MALLKILLSDLATLFPDAYLGKTANFSLFPTVTYNIIDSNTLRMNSFSNRSEQYNVQFSIFDNNADCVDLVDLQEEIEEILQNAVQSTRFVEIRKVNTIGPRYITHEKVYQIIDLYQITICAERVYSPINYIFTGLFDNDWELAQNYSPIGIPIETDNVLVSSLQTDDPFTGTLYCSTLNVSGALTIGGYISAVNTTFQNTASSDAVIYGNARCYWPEGERTLGGIVSGTITYDIYQWNSTIGGFPFSCKPLDVFDNGAWIVTTEDNQNYSIRSGDNFWQSVGTVPKWANSFELASFDTITVSAIKTN